ncbi:MAG: hypothetical protein QM831_00195 [Kofleriaceae bacterium]
MTKVSTVAVVAMSLQDVNDQVFYLASEMAKAKLSKDFAKQIQRSSFDDLAKAYLQALIDGKRADEVIEHVATIQRDRTAWRQAVTHVWPKAKNVKALEAAYQNLAKAFGSDPELLPIGVAAAKKIKDAALAKQRAALLKRAVVAEAVARKKGVGLTKLAPEDQIVAYERILTNPEGQKPAMLVAAFDAMFANPSAMHDFQMQNAVQMVFARDPSVFATWPDKAKTDPRFAKRVAKVFETSWVWMSEGDETLVAMYLSAIPKDQNAALYKRAAASKNKVIAQAVKRG